MPGSDAILDILVRAQLDSSGFDARWNAIEKSLDEVRDRALIGRDAFAGLDTGADKLEAVQRELAAAGVEGVRQFDRMGSSLDDAASSGDDLQEAMRKLERELAGIGNETGISELADDFDRARAESQALYESQKKALAQLAATGQQGTAQYADLVAELMLTQQELEKIVKAEAQVHEAFKQPLPAPKVPDPGELFFKSEALSKAGEFFNGVAERGKELRQELRQLPAATGLVGDALEKVNASATRLFHAGVGESLAETTKFAAVAEKQLGDAFDTKGMDAFLVRAGGISKVFDKDVPEVIQKSRTFVKQFNLDGQQAGDLIALAMQRAGNGLDDVLDTTDEYSQHVKAAGFNAAEFVGILTRGIEQGARDTDKLGDAIKETGIRLKAGDITTALAGISSPITNTIREIARAGEQGQISVKEVLQRSNAEIERAFNAGEIGQQVRGQLQVAISGTPAEDIGSDLYGRIFSAPIDTAAISKQGAIAGQQMADAVKQTVADRISRIWEGVGDRAAALFAPIASAAGRALGVVGQLAPALSLLSKADILPLDKVGAFLKDMPGLASKAGPALSGIFTAATGPIGLTILGVTALAALLTWFFTSTDRGRRMWDSISQGAERLWDRVKPIFTSIGQIILTTGELVGTVIVAQFELAANIVSLFIELIASGADALVSLVSGSTGVEKSFTSIGSILSDVKISLDGMLASLQVLKDGALDIVDKLAHFDIGGAIEAGKSLGDKVTEGFENAVTDGVIKRGLGNLQKGVERASAMKVKVEAIADTRKLIADYQAAQTKVQEIQNQLGAAKASGDTSGVQRLTAELHKAQDAAAGIGDQLQQKAPGAVAGVHTITEASGKLRTVYDINTGALSKQLDAQSKAFGVQGQSEVLGFSMQLAGVAQAYQQQQAEVETLQKKISDGSASQKEIDRFNELVGTVNNSREAMVKAFADGSKAGLVTEQGVKAVAKALNISEDEARLLAKQMSETPKAARDGKRDIDALGKSFGNAMQVAQQEVQRLSAAYAEMLRTGQNDPSIIENLRKAQTELARLNEAQRVASLTPEDIAKAAAERQKNREELQESRQARLNAAQIARIKDQDEQKRRQIDETERAAVRAATIEIEYQNKIKAASVSAEDREAAITAAKQAADQRDQAHADARNARLELAGEIAARNAQKAIDAEKATNDASTQVMQQRLQRLKDLALQSTAAVELQRSLELDVLHRTLADQQRAAIEATQTFTDFRDKLLAAVAVDPTITPDEVIKRLADERARIAATLSSGTDPIARAYQEIARASGEQEVQITRDYAGKIEEARLKALPNALERELGLRLLAAQQALDAELRAAGDSAELKRQAQERFDREAAAITAERAVGSELDTAKRVRLQALADAQKAFNEKMEAARGNHALELDALVEFENAKRKAEADFLDQSNAELETTLDVARDLYKGFLDDTSADRSADLDKQRQDNDTALNDLDVSLAQRSASLEDFFTQHASLVQKAAEIEQQSGQDTADFWNRINKGLIEAFETSAGRLAEKSQKLAEQFSDLSLAGKDTGDKLADAFKSAGASIIATTLQVGAEGQNMLRGFANATLDVMTKTLEGLIPALVALIFGEDVAKDPLLGGIIAGVATAALYALVGAARHALDAAHFAEGGLVHGGRQLAWLNDDPDEEPEYVMKGRVTRRELPLLEYLNTEQGDSRNYFREHALEILATDGDSFYVDASGRLAFGADGMMALAMVADRTERMLAGIADIDARMALIHGLPDAMRAGNNYELAIRTDEMLAELRAQRDAIDHQTDVMERRLVAVENAVRGQSHAIATELRQWLRDMRNAARDSHGDADIDDLLALIDRRNNVRPR
ncbi:MAG TPA: phage tail tape measure protein [Candidatus Kapabacteria bacterium]|nr:phage tail tape measure protein [Candidatus Kapabacteria bacterium]